MPFKSLDPAWAQRHPAVESQKASEKARKGQKSAEINAVPCNELRSRNWSFRRDHWQKLRNSIGRWLLVAWQAVIATESQFAYHDEQKNARKLIAEKALPFKPIPGDILEWKLQYADVKERYKMLVLWGRSGTGKSRLARSLYGYCTVKCKTWPPTLDKVYVRQTGQSGRGLFECQAIQAKHSFGLTEQLRRCRSDNLVNWSSTCCAWPQC